MLPLQPYHPQRYPPVGPRWVQFGDDILGDVTNDAHTMLARKNQWKQQLHLGRLQQQGMMPSHVKSQVPASHPDPEEDAVQSYDRPPPPPPHQRRMREQSPEPRESQEPASSSGSHSLMNTISSGANSTAASMGAGVVHGVTYGVAAASTAVLKGISN